MRLYIICCIAIWAYAVTPPTPPPFSHRITDVYTCEKKGGHGYNYCRGTKVHYCCGICKETAICPQSHPALYHCACNPIPADIAKKTKKVCPRPSKWCTHRRATYELRDCDGDGIPDPTCFEGLLRSAVTVGSWLSGSNCKDTWPRGKCTRKPAAVLGEVVLAAAPSQFQVVLPCFIVVVLTLLQLL
jgi:hypothetical protein